MSFEQKRNAERLPLDAPLDAMVGATLVKIVELSAIGCRIEHQEKLSIGAAATLRFIWAGRTIDVRSKVARTQLRSAVARGMFYESGLTFANSLDEAPEQLRELLASIAEPVVPPRIVDKITTNEVPAIKLPPIMPGEDTLRRLRLKTERPSSLPLEAFAPVEPEYDIDALDFDDPPEAANPFASEADAVALAVEPPLRAPEPEPEPEAEYVECRLENGTWHRRIITSVLQPPEGFITLPASDQELDMLCKSYQYADPETRRLIRISLELAATQKRD